MKKSLLKKLTCMARDGDPEAVEALAEAVEEMIATPSTEPETAAAVVAAKTGPDPVPEAEPAGEIPAAAGVSEGVAAVLERLDRLIALLTPADSAVSDEPDEGPGELPEELAEVVEEAVEAVAEGNALPEEVAAIVEEVIAEADPEASVVLEPEEAEDCDAKNTGDTFRQALRAIRPALREMSPRDSSRVCADIAARLGFVPGQKVTDDRVPAGRKTGNEEAYADLGKRIMARRNPTYKGGKENG